MTMITETTKLCTACGLVKPVTEYRLRNKKESLEKLRSRCTPCFREKGKMDKRRRKAADPELGVIANRKSQLKARYGITLEDYERMNALQNGECAICRRTAAEAGGRGKMLVVDHNHDTNEVRGLLCGPCNIAIGLLQDSPKVTRAALEYMETQGHYGE